MKTIDIWFPRNYRIDGMILTGIINSGENWQLYETYDRGRALFVTNELLDYWIAGEIIEFDAWNQTSYGNYVYSYLASSSSYILAPVREIQAQKNFEVALSFATALTATRRLTSQAALESGIFVERYARILPMPDQLSTMDDSMLLGYVVTGGTQIPITNTRRILQLTPSFSISQLQKILHAAGFAHSQYAEDQSSPSISAPKVFNLPGRKNLSNFLQEHVIDIIEHEKDYAAVGITFPSAFILQGPPGCGKTYAIERLVDYLNWPMYSIDSISIGSPYIHETGKKIGSVFEKAMENAPAIIVIDEMEAFLQDRTASSTSSSNHHVEEVAEFLRMIPIAREHRVLVIAMTNLIQSIDPAICRRGRFDHIIEVGMPTSEEIEQVLRNSIEKLPHDTIPYADLAEKLDGSPMSDVAFIIREAARLAAKNKLNKLTSDILWQVVTEHNNVHTEEHTIGFHP